MRAALCSVLRDAVRSLLRAVERWAQPRLPSFPPSIHPFIHSFIHPSLCLASNPSAAFVQPHDLKGHGEAPKYTEFTPTTHVKDADIGNTMSAVHIREAHQAMLAGGGRGTRVERRVNTNAGSRPPRGSTSARVAPSASIASCCAAFPLFLRYVKSIC